MDQNSKVNGATKMKAKEHEKEIWRVESCLAEL
jgi:hypothetical protein